MHDCHQLQYQCHHWNPLRKSTPKLTMGAHIFRHPAIELYKRQFKNLIFKDNQVHRGKTICAQQWQWKSWLILHKNALWFQEFKVMNMKMMTRRPSSIWVEVPLKVLELCYLLFLQSKCTHGWRTWPAFELSNQHPLAAIAGNMEVMSYCKMVTITEVTWQENKNFMLERNDATYQRICEHLVENFIQKTVKN